MKYSDLRYYQQDAYNATFENWNSGNDIVFIQSGTGTGKSVVFTFITKTLHESNARILFLCNRKELIDQAHAHFRKAGIPAGIIMDGYETRFDLRCQVGSIQTIIRRSILPQFDYVIVDEAHFVTRENSYGTILNRFPNAKMLLVSATPWRMNGQGFTDIVDGKTTTLIQTRSMRQLINEGWLVPFKYLIPHVPDLSGISMRGGEYDEAEAEEAMKLVPIVDSYLKHTNGMQGIGFAINVHHSHYIVRQYDQAGIRTVHIDANTPKHDRNQAFKDFKSGEVKMIWNVGIISYGVDLPHCQFAQLAAPSKSLAAFGQKTGRVTRPAAGTISSSMTPQERCLAIANSCKPHGIILDNAGCFIDNGFPDDDIDWPMHFNGTRNKRETIPDEFIEVTMFEFEDPETGGRTRTANAEECEGMILIEVTRELQDNYKSIKHLKEFDRIYREACISMNVKKPGYAAYYRFESYMRDRNIVCEDVTWRYLKKRLVEDVATAIARFCDEQQAQGKHVVPSMNKHCLLLKEKAVDAGWLDRERKKYKQMIGVAV